MEASQREVSGDIPQTVIEYKVLYRAVADVLAGAEIIGGLNTIVLIVDTQSLPEVPHWQHVARIWQSRLRLSAREVWAIYHMRPQECGLQAVSYYWAGTFVLEAFQLLAPQFNYILIDSDAVPTALWEVVDLEDYSLLGRPWPQSGAPDVPDRRAAFGGQCWCRGDDWHG